MNKTATQKNTKLFKQYLHNKEAILGSELMQSALERDVARYENIRTKGLLGGSWQNVKDVGTRVKGKLTGDLPLTGFGNAYEKEKAFWDAHRKKLAEEERIARLQKGAKETSAMNKNAFLASTALGAGVGGLIGAVRERDVDEDRIDAILRSMLTGGAVGAGGRLGGNIGRKIGKIKGGPIGEILHGMGGEAIGTLGAFQLARRRRRPRDKSEIPNEVSAMDKDAFLTGYCYKEAGILNLAKGLINTLKGTKVTAIQKQIAKKQKTIKGMRSSSEIKKFKPTLEKRILAEQDKLREARLLRGGAIAGTAAIPAGAAYLALSGDKTASNNQVSSWAEFLTKYN